VEGQDHLSRTTTHQAVRLGSSGGTGTHALMSRQIRRRGAGSALMMTSAFSLAESAILISLLSLVFWFAPAGYQPDLSGWLSGEPSPVFTSVVAIAYAIAVFFLEPFYVASGFAMYLNRRAELEAWDIEQEFRRAFAP